MVTFHANGGTFYNEEGDEVGATRVGYWKAGWDIQMEDWMEPTPRAEDQVFLGYALTEYAGEDDIVLTWGEEGKYPIPVEPGDSITLYAVWGDGLQVIFDAGDGSFYDDEGDKEGTTRDGYWRAGWVIDMDDWMRPEPGAEGKVFLGYALGREATDEDVIHDWGTRYRILDDAREPLTLYAVWGNGVQVTFNTNGGIFRNDEGVEDETLRYGNWLSGKKIEMDGWMHPEPKTDTEGQVFLGYALSNEDNAPIVFDWGMRYRIPDSEITLYGVWATGVKVTFNANGGCFGKDDGEDPETTRFGYWMPSWKIEMHEEINPYLEGKDFLGFALRNAADAPICGRVWRAQIH